MSAVHKGQKIDSRQFEAAKAAKFSGISVRYGNNSMSDRALKKTVRCKATKTKAKVKETSISGNNLAIAQDLLEKGISKEVVEQFLAHAK
jgi:site-specific recombinase XerD